jgi:hypothetical protein
VLDPNASHKREIKRLLQQALNIRAQNDDLMPLRKPSDSMRKWAGRDLNPTPCGDVTRSIPLFSLSVSIFPEA